MITFVLCVIALVLGYFLYGKFVETVFGPDDRDTPAVVKADGVDFMVLPNWKIFMIQFLNIAGTGPIFGAIMGAKFGPAAYLWIVLGCIFAGATHDYLSGMISIRKGGAGLPEIIGDTLGATTRKVMLVFSVVLLIMVGAVFVYSPAEILDSIAGSTTMWIIIIFAYYFIATMLPVDKVIGRIYPIFAFSLLFMAAALMVMLIIKWPSIPELWDGLGNKALTVDSNWSSQLYPCLFITIACGAISGFHATQSPLMGRCMKSERMGRPIFYGAMITEGIVASYFFYAEPQPGYQVITEYANNGFSTSAPKVVNIICNDWLGVVGGILAMLGVVAAPITSGDTALRSARLIIADFVRMEQRSIKHRLIISVPIFLVCIALLLWQVENPDGFNVIWQYFGWSNQTLSVFTLWAIVMYLMKNGKPYYFVLIPALFMTTVCATFLFVSKQALGLPDTIGYLLGIVVLFVAYGWFHMVESKYKKTH